MKRIIFAGLAFVLLFVLMSTVQAQSPQETLDQYISDLRKNPNNQELREKIIKFVHEMKPRPAIPKEAQKPLYKAAILIKEAKDNSGFEMAIRSYQEALSIAPWWPEAYYNLGKAQEAAGQYDAAARNLKLYLLTEPKTEDADQVEKFLYALEAKKELAQKQQSVERKHKDAVGKAEMPPDYSGMWRKEAGDNYYQYYFRVSGHQISLFKFHQSPDRTKCAWFHSTGTMDGRRFEGKLNDASTLNSDCPRKCGDLINPAGDMTGEISEDGSRVEINYSNIRLSPRMGDMLDYARQHPPAPTASLVLIRE
jgi:tetratricopeptide (TPR) repeat protein